MFHEIREKYNGGQVFNYLLISDLHIDNPKCNRQLLFKVLDRAKEINARIFIFGDLFCFMQGKYDKRANKSAIRPEHNTDTYLDTVIEDTARVLLPYAHLISIVSDGNHETSVNNRNETNVLRRLCAILSQSGNEVKHMPYMGYTRLRFVHNSGGLVRNVNLFHDHGHWGGIVSKGTQAALRYQAIAPDADVVYSGHTHDRNLMEVMRYKLTEKEVVLAPQYYVKGGTFKEEFLSGSGWAVERIGMPKNLGGWWMRVTVAFAGVDINFSMT